LLFLLLKKNDISKLINLKTSIFATNQTLTLNGTQIIDYYNSWKLEDLRMSMYSLKFYSPLFFMNVYCSCSRKFHWRVSFKEINFPL
jgi:hypothetical protein